ncbi:MAG: hypothetical protein QOD31_2616, partial [Pseudonocardiales bacterium]|nr:hypothetical protein [Pseudonocardiales bacterium]
LNDQQTLEIRDDFREVSRNRQIRPKSRYDQVVSPFAWAERA